MSNSLQLHGLQHARPPSPSPTPRVYSNSCPLSRWCHPTNSFSVIPFSSCLQSFPSSGSFQKKRYQRISKKNAFRSQVNWCKCWREICFYLLTWLVNLYIILDLEYLFLEDLGKQATLPKEICFTCLLYHSVMQSELSGNCAVTSSRALGIPFCCSVATVCYTVLPVSFHRIISSLTGPLRVKLPSQLMEPEIFPRWELSSCQLWEYMFFLARSKMGLTQKKPAMASGYLINTGDGRMKRDSEAIVWEFSPWLLIRITGGLFKDPAWGPLKTTWFKWSGEELGVVFLIALRVSPTCNQSEESSVQRTMVASYR